MMYPVQSNMSALEKRNPIALALMQAQQTQAGPMVPQLGGPRSADPNMASPKSIGEGISSLGDGLSQRPQAMFPAAPGGIQPSFFTAMKNMFSGNSNGGLY